MAIQRTFDLIPTSFTHQNGYKPPMTSKQVKRAHLKTNREARLTRAEQYKLEAKELARLKQEYQREIASAKARAIRDNKTSKALVETQLRKEAGLLPKSNRLGRNRSQLTISLFARHGCISIKNQQQNRIKTEEDSDSCEKQSDEERRQDAKLDFMKGPVEKPATIDPDSSDDEFGSFPFCSQLEMIATSIDSSHKRLKSPVSQMPQIQERSLSKIHSQKPELKLISQKRLICEDSHVDNLEEPPQLTRISQHSSQAFDVKANHETNYLHYQTDIFKANDKSTKLLNPLDLRVSPFTAVKSCPNPPQQSITVKDRMPPSIDMPHLQERPYLEAEKMASITNISTFESNNRPAASLQFTDDFLEDFLRSPTLEIDDFLDDVDATDFHHSPSQEVEDFFDDDLDTADFPSYTQIMIGISSGESAQAENLNLNSSANSHLLQLRPQDHSKVSVKTTANTCDKTENSDVTIQQDNFDDLICTQDLAVLSQELRDINAPISAVSKSEQRLTHEKAKEKRRFFEEKEEDLVKAALYESKMMFSKSTVSTKSIKQELSLSVKTTLRSASSSVSSHGTDYGVDDFACDEWEELTVLC